MNNGSILLSIMFVLSLLALPLTGCENPPWETGRNLVLNVDTPKDGLTVNAPTVTVSGRVVGIQSKGAKVTINNMDATVTEGKYSANVTLEEGKNVINIGATNGTANLSQQVTVTYVPAKK